MDFILVYGHLKEGVKKTETGAQRQDKRKLAQFLKLKHRSFHSGRRRNWFYYEDGLAVTQAVSRGCGVPTLGAIGDLTAHNPEQPVLADPVQLCNLQRPLPLSATVCTLSKCTWYRLMTAVLLPLSIQGSSPATPLKG